MTIESCILNNAISGYKLKRDTQTSTLVDSNNPTKGYTKTSVQYDIVCMQISFISKSKGLLSETEYILNVLYDETIGDITEKDTIIDPSGNTKEILLVSRYKVGSSSTKSFTLYIK